MSHHTDEEQAPMSGPGQARTIWQRLAWMGLIASLHWCACAPLQGTDCRSDEDCSKPSVCQEGWCVDPIQLQQPPACPSKPSAILHAPSLLSKDHEELGQAASDGTHLYWTDRKRGHLARQPVKGGPHELLHEGLGPIYGLHLDGEALYLTRRAIAGESQGAILKTTIHGGPIQIIADGIANAKQLLHDDKYLYWNVVGSFSKEPGGEIARVAKDGSDLRILVKELRPIAIAIDATHLYWIASHEEGALRRMALDDPGQVETIVPALSYARALAVDESFVYYLADGLHKIPKRGGTTPQRLSPDLSGTALLLDDHFAYIATGNGLRQIPLHCPKAISAYSTPTPGQINALASDASYIFFLLQSDGVSTSEIFRAAKRPPSEWKPAP